MPTLRTLSNADARAHFLARHGLAAAPQGTGKGADLADVIDQLGFVQVDSINTVARAHHMILRSRRQSYREPALARLYDQRGLFEHWTHDASLIPMAFFPYWRLKCDRDRQRLRQRWKNWRSDGYEAKFEAVLNRISDHGPCSSAEVGKDETRSSGGWWDWHPSKTALEYLWRVGELSVTRRDGFRKIYDLTERVIPPEHLNRRHAEAEITDWACNAAVDRLGFATSGEIAAFWDLLSPQEVKAWCARELANGRLSEILVQTADGKPRRQFCRPDLPDSPIPGVTGRLRVLSPFDPALRDRKRAERLFGFHYRIEIFVPEAQRRYGYYVFPLLEGSRLVGRIDMKCHRECSELRVRAVWPEPGVDFGQMRRARLMSEIERMARFTGARDVVFASGWLRDANPA